MEEDNIEDQCSPQDRAEVLQFSLAALHYPLPEESLLSAAKIDTDFEFGHLCSDAVWTLAFAMNETIEGTALCIALHKKNQMPLSSFLCFVVDLGQKFTVDTMTNCDDLGGRRNVLEAIKKNLDATNFEGLSV